MVTIWDSDQIIRQVMTLCSEVLLEGLLRRDETLAAMSKLIPEETVQRIRGAVEEEQAESRKLKAEGSKLKAERKGINAA